MRIRLSGQVWKKLSFFCSLVLLRVKKSFTFKNVHYAWQVGCFKHEKFSSCYQCANIFLKRSHIHNSLNFSMNFKLNFFRTFCLIFKLLAKLFVELFAKLFVKFYVKPVEELFVVRLVFEFPFEVCPGRINLSSNCLSSRIRSFRPPDIMHEA